MANKFRILSLQPYFGGSHQQFHDGWVAGSRFEWTTLSLPARHWKWRMRHASISFSEEIRRRVKQGESWDAVVCTDMLNVADFKGLVGGQTSQIPLVVYFHENQFAYPSQFDYQRDQHFPFTNLLSAIAADEVWFNSRFNFDSMMEGIRRHAKRWPDCVPSEAIDSIEAKIRIQPPGIESPPMDLDPYYLQRHQRSLNREPIHIVWAARWEHDKNPMALFEALDLMSQVGIPFQISLIGQAFSKIPPGIAKIRDAFPDQIRRWGYQSTRLDYWTALAEADVFVSTAHHEFFGLSAAEAIAAGAWPLLPDRLAYPELLSYAVDSVGRESDGELDGLGPMLYDGTSRGLFESLRRIDQERYSKGWQTDPEVGERLLSHIGWGSRVKLLDEALAGVVSGSER